MTLVEKFKRDKPYIECESLPDKGKTIAWLKRNEVIKWLSAQDAEKVDLLKAFEYDEKKVEAGIDKARKEEQEGEQIAEQSDKIGLRDIILKQCQFHCNGKPSLGCYDCIMEILGKEETRIAQMRVKWMKGAYFNGYEDAMKGANNECETSHKIKGMMKKPDYEEAKEAITKAMENIGSPYSIQERILNALNITKEGE